jgi:hypothetical protein
MGVAAMLATSNVWAEDSPAPSASEAPTVVAPDKPARVWYGWQPLITDGVAVASFAGFLAVTFAESSATYKTIGTYNDASSVFGGTAAAFFYLGAPVIHAAHDHWDRALGSLGLRIGIPILTTIAGVAIGSGSPNDCDCFGLSPGQSIGLFVGFTLGALGAMAIDDFVLAYDDPPKPSSSQSSFFIAPTVSPLRNGASLGVVGMF